MRMEMKSIIVNSKLARHIQYRKQVCFQAIANKKLSRNTKETYEDGHWVLLSIYLFVQDIVVNRCRCLMYHLRNYINRDTRNRNLSFMEFTF